jgi:ABC-type transport system involved in multi-copper enzyme maturation permease subunit
VSKEIERRSLYPLLAKPLSRGELLLGKFSGLGFTLLVNVAVMAASLCLTLVATQQRADPSLLKAVYAIFLGLLLIVALALFFSTITSSALAALFTVCIVVAGRLSDVIKNMRDVAHGAPDWLVQTLYYAIPNLRDFDLKDRVVYGLPVSFGELGLITVYAALYIGVVLGAAHLALRSRDFQ